MLNKSRPKSRGIPPGGNYHTPGTSSQGPGAHVHPLCSFTERPRGAWQGWGCRWGGDTGMDPKLFPLLPLCLLPRAKGPHTSDGAGVYLQGDKAAERRSGCSPRPADAGAPATASRWHRGKRSQKTELSTARRGPATLLPHQDLCGRPGVWPPEPGQAWAPEAQVGHLSQVCRRVATGPGDRPAVN